MKRYFNYILMLHAMLFSIFVYLFYRTEKTVINEIFISLVSWDRFVAIREWVLLHVPLHQQVIYSIPEGLWVGVITLSSRFMFVRVGKQEIDLKYLPLVFAFGLELFQLVGVTFGQFDFWDLFWSLFFWALALVSVKFSPPRQNVFQPFNVHSWVFMGSYLIVFLAHVWR